jgi:hypothetical protein
MWQGLSLYDEFLRYPGRCTGDPGISPTADTVLARVIRGDGLWFALFSIAQGGYEKLVLLVFERDGQVREETKAAMWACLSIAEKLVRELPAEEIAFTERGE